MFDWEEALAHLIVDSPWRQPKHVRHFQHAEKPSVVVKWFFVISHFFIFVFDHKALGRSITPRKG
jgi:hypothetical protein